MITIIIKNYFYILLPVLTTAVLLFLFGLYLISRFVFKSRKAAPCGGDEMIQQIICPKTPLVVSSHDIKAIAGDDVISTQLDLARAYIETGRKQIAKKILNFVIEQGSEDQQQEAKKLLTLIPRHV